MKDGPLCSKKQGRRLSAGLPLRRWKHADHGCSTAIESIERGPEYLDGFVPWISNVTAALELRLQIAGNDDSFPFHPEHFANPARLFGVHHYHQIGFTCVCLCYRTRAMPREVDPSLGAECNRIRWNRAIAAWIDS